MKNIKKILFVVLFGLLTFSSFAVNMEDTEKAENGQEFMQIFMTNVEYEPRFLAWQNSLKNIALEEKEKVDAEAEKLLQTKTSGEVKYKTKDGTLIISSKIENGKLASVTMYDKSGAITTISQGQITVFYRNGKNAVVTKSDEIDPSKGFSEPEVVTGELYYPNGILAGKSDPKEEHIIFYHKNGKPFFESKKGWDKEKRY